MSLERTNKWPYLNHSENLDQVTILFICLVHYIYLASHFISLYPSNWTPTIDCQESPLNVTVALLLCFSLVITLLFNHYCRMVLYVLEEWGISQSFTSPLCGLLEPLVVGVLSFWVSLGHAGTGCRLNGQLDGFFS